MIEREGKRRKGEEEVSPLCVNPRRRTCSPVSGRPFKGPFHHPPFRVSSRPLLIAGSRFGGTNEMFFNSRYPALKTCLFFGDQFQMSLAENHRFYYAREKERERGDSVFISREFFRF